MLFSCPENVYQGSSTVLGLEFTMWGSISLADNTSSNAPHSVEVLMVVIVVIVGVWLDDSGVETVSFSCIAVEEHDGSKN
jgi:hypothetical protein